MGVSFLPLTCGTFASNFGAQALCQVSVPPEPVHQPILALHFLENNHGYVDSWLTLTRFTPSVSYSNTAFPLISFLTRKRNLGMDILFCVRLLQITGRKIKVQKDEMAHSI